MQIKKIFFLFIFIASVTLVSFNKTNKPRKETLPEIKRNTIECIPDINYINGVIDDFSDIDFHISKRRKDIATLTSNELAEIRKAVKKMKALSATNPKSWAYQTNIHGKDGTSNALFGTCEHNTAFFLAWHRVYLYYFEGILRSFMTNGNNESNKIGLPYWNFLATSNNKIPQSCRVVNYSSSFLPNPLYNSMRDSGMNAGDELAPVVADQFKFVMDRYGDYFTFQTAIENVHGAIHTGVGGFLRITNTAGVVKTIKGDMYDKPKASNDFLFWLLHANVDRLWQKWLQKGGGNCDPREASNAYFYNKVFTFYNSTGKKKTFTGRGIIELADSLHYGYDDISTPIVNNSNGNVTDSLSPSQESIIVSETDDLEIKRGVTAMQFGSIKPPTISFQSANTWLLFAANYNYNNVYDSIPSKNIYLTFDEIKVNEWSGGGVIEIYINPPKLSSLNHKSKFFAGLLDVFTAISKHNNKSIDDNPHNNFNKNRNPIRLHIGHVVEALNLSYTDLKKTKLFFVRRGNYRNGIEKSSSVNMVVKGISIVEYL